MQTHRLQGEWVVPLTTDDILPSDLREEGEALHFTIH
jgi:hypothetical protein